MKAILLILFACVFSCTTNAQNSLFVRVYNTEGKKIYNGHVYIVTDSSLLLIGKRAPDTIFVRNIGSIKTKHSAGNNLLIGSVAGAISGAIVGAVSADPNDLPIPSTTGEGATTGALLGLPVGAAIGGLTILFKHSRTFIINGDPLKWKEFEAFYTAKK
jgi:hypothetical protein